MKKHFYIAAAAVLFVVLKTTAQPVAYAFTQTTATYADLTGATSANNGQLWDDPEIGIPLGFDFQFYSKTIDSVLLGYGLGGTVSDSLYGFLESERIIMPFEADLIDRGDLTGTSVSPISYKLEGMPGSRVFKLEWNNAGFYNEGDSLNTLNDFVNFQLWLYEGSNVIEYRYGTSSIANAAVDFDNEAGPVVGLANFPTSQSYFLSGSLTTPTVSNTLTWLGGVPQNGTVYRFTPLATSTAETDLMSQTTLFPNPLQTAAALRIDGRVTPGTELRITDALGRTVRLLNVTSQVTLIERGNMNSGVYFYRLSNGAGTLAAGKLSVD
jgi:hypothetical protein